MEFDFQRRHLLRTIFVCPIKVLKVPLLHINKFVPTLNFIFCFSYSKMFISLAPDTSFIHILEPQRKLFFHIPGPSLLYCFYLVLFLNIFCTVMCTFSLSYRELSLWWTSNHSNHIWSRYCIVYALPQSHFSSYQTVIYAKMEILFGEKE